MFKKEFQKTIAKIRSDYAMRDYPKAMCTSAQMMKNQATVNCGGEWRSAEFSRNLAERIMKDPRFTALVAYHKGKAVLEQGRYGDRSWTQIRIHYQEI